MEDILTRAEARVVKFAKNGVSETVVQITVSEFRELLVEIIRLRSVLEGISETLPHFLSVKRLQKMAREGVLPE